MIYKKTALDNGLNVVSIPMPHMKSVSLGIWVAVGGRYEDEENAGISHFIEHLLFKGTLTRTSRDIKTEIESKGGSLNAFTGEECTCFLARMPREHWKAAFDVLSDMVVSPRLDDKDMEKERLIILEEIKMYLDLPNQHVHEILNGLMWPGQPLGMNLSGTARSVKSMALSDIRSYKERHYMASKIIVIAAGALEHRDLEDKASSAFSSMDSRRASGFEKANAGQNAPRFKVENKKTKQTHIVLGFHALPKGDPDIYILSLLNIIMGGNMSSRLYHEIRERSALAYEIHSYLRKMSDAGAFAVSAGVDNRKAVKATELILRELVKISKEGVSDLELSNAKDFYTGQFELALEETMDRMLWAGDNLVTIGKVPEVDDVFRRIRKAGKDDIARMAGRIFRSKGVNFAAIGPIDKKAEKEIKGLSPILQ